ncbi:MAG: branched-chain amino acid ABC transporter permease [Ardenticatenaceae bacterium]|nr:branched-chain amino acid ABC transporter permease [Ardenticatenaceae bacterium]HBY94303.1 branched-chain amino acid ABC transporter permease [Chloroflexota bacterium]
MNSQQILQLVVSGIATGSIYALVALGFVLIYSVTGIINFAQGEFVMVGALTMVTLTGWGWPMPVGFVTSVLVVAGLGALLHTLALRPARRASVVTLIIITVGAAITLRGIGLILWGTNPYALSLWRGRPYRIAGAIIRRPTPWIVATTIIVVLLLYLFFERTLYGKAVRACALNPIAARLMGIKVERIAMLAFAVAGALGAIAGIVITPVGAATYDMGLLVGLKGFAAAIMGGLVSAPAAVAGGLLLGVLEALGAGLISSGFKDAIAFFVLLIVLLVRPLGLLGRIERGLQR